MKKVALLTLLMPVALAACGGGQKIVPERTLTEIYDEAYTLLETRKYARAAVTFQEAEHAFPSSPWAADALMMAAYAAYLDEDFAGALIVIDRFMRFHPGHSAVSYVMYLRGMCYYRQVSDVRREPGMSIYALNAFETLEKRFPKSDYAQNAVNKIMILKNYIAGKIMFSARRDMKRENWPAAIEQLQQIVTGATETTMTPEALFRLTEAFTAIGLPSQAAGYADMLRLNFPDNAWTKKLPEQIGQK
jgi:outer membrane protein assembly factor BamD